ncbi:MAG: hypothetical protein KGV43_03330 [Arcobacter sp.]|nr:hypothetical protein [Arcobacter sp.]
MEIVEILNDRIGNLLYEYEKVKSENNLLKQELEMLKNENDKLVKNNQNMSLKIDSVLTLTGVKK